MFNRILTVTAAILVIGICCGTVIGFATHRAAPGRALRRAEPLPSAASVAGAPGADTLAVYAGIARIRAVTKADPQRPDDGGTTVVITPWLPIRRTIPRFMRSSHKRAALSGQQWLPILLITQLVNCAQQERSPLKTRCSPRLTNSLCWEN